MKEYYSSEFRREAIKLARLSDKPMQQIAFELGIKRTTLYEWISRAMKDKTSYIEKTEPSPGSTPIFI